MYSLIQAFAVTSFCWWFKKKNHHLRELLQSYGCFPFYFALSFLLITFVHYYCFLLSAQLGIVLLLSPTFLSFPKYWFQLNFLFRLHVCLRFIVNRLFVQSCIVYTIVTQIASLVLLV